MPTSPSFLSWRLHSTWRNSTICRTFLLSDMLLKRTYLGDSNRVYGCFFLHPSPEAEMTKPAICLNAVTREGKRRHIEKTRKRTYLRDIMPPPNKIQNRGINRRVQNGGRRMNNFISHFLICKELSSSCLWEKLTCTFMVPTTPCASKPKSHGPNFEFDKSG